MTKHILSDFVDKDGDEDIVPAATRRTGPAVASGRVSPHVPLPFGREGVLVECGLPLFAEAVAADHLRVRWRGGPMLLPTP